MRRLTMVLTFLFGIFLIKIGFDFEKNIDAADAAIFLHLGGLGTIAFAFVALKHPRYTGFWLTLVYFGLFPLSSYAQDRSLLFLVFPVIACHLLAVWCHQHTRLPTMAHRMSDSGKGAI